MPMLVKVATRIYEVLRRRISVETSLDEQRSREGKAVPLNPGQRCCFLWWRLERIRVSSSNQQRGLAVSVFCIRVDLQLMHVMGVKLERWVTSLQ